MRLLQQPNVLRMAARFARLLQRSVSSNASDALRHRAVIGAHILRQHYSLLSNPRADELLNGASVGGGTVDGGALESFSAQVNNPEHTVGQDAVAESQQGSDAEIQSAGRFLRDPREWVWMPPVPRKLGEAGPNADSASSTTAAFQWLRKCQPQLPHAVIHKLFRKREVRLVETAENSDQPGEVHTLTAATK